MTDVDLTEESESTESSPRRVGRPRASGVEPEGDVRQQILDSAAVLFVEHGYAGASTREIAAAAGLRQGSLMHYFRRKQDIFAALMSRMMAPALEHAKELESTSLPPESKFYRLIHQDVLELCADPCATLMFLPEAKSPEFKDFWDEREKLRAQYRLLISTANDSGVFDVADISLANNAAFGVVESVIAWYEPGSGSSPNECADHVAEMILSGLLADSDDFDRITGQRTELAESATK